MKAILDGVFDHAGDLTATVLLVFIAIGLGYVVYAFAFGKLPTPGEHKRLIQSNEKTIARCDETEHVLQKVTDELSTARILHAAATVRIEFLEAENRRKDGELAEVRARVARLEAELDVRRESEWRQQSSGKGGAQ